MFQDLKIKPQYDGFIFLAESKRNPPILLRHHHVELELNLVIEGSISYVVSGRTYSFKKGSLLWFFPNQVHQLVDRTPDARYYVAVFKPDLIQSACHGVQYRELHRKSVKSGNVLRRILSSDSFQLLQRVIDSLMKNSLDPDLLNREGGFGLSSTFQFDHGDPDMLNAGLRYLLIQCWRLHCEESPMKAAPPIHPAVSKVLALLSQPRESHQMETLCKKAGISENYLSRLFHRQIGVPLSHYRNSLRISHFIAICRSDASVRLTEAAFQAGFGSYAQFHKIFQESYGMGPRDFFSKGSVSQF